MANYKIMHKNIIIATTQDLTVTDILRPELCPVMIKSGSSIVPWIALRSVDMHRSSSRHLFNALRLTPDATVEDKIRTGHAVTIEDNWWVQQESEDCSYEKLKAYSKTAADIAIGDTCSDTVDREGYTELGTLGSFEKAWRKNDGVWYLHKKGAREELLSEYFSYCLLDEMLVDVARYSVYRYTPESGIEKTLVLSKDFTEGGKYDFEPFACYFGENEDYRYIISELEKMEDRMPGVTGDYVRMCFYDALLNNGDRHNGNAGFLRGSESGKLLRLAPLYDYNQALIALDGNLQFIDTQKGCMGYFAQNMPLDRIQGIIPVKDTLAEAILKAQARTLKEFPENAKACEMCGRYIMAAYDYCMEECRKQMSNIHREHGQTR